jgi:PiT family inorganic phosphate transporter
MLFVLIILALFYAFLNGYRDSSSILAGVIASRALPPALALALAAIAEFIAPFLFGVAVARALATGLIDPETITLQTLVVGMAAALTWTLVAWWRGIPSSSSHALIGGLLGAALLSHGPDAIVPGGLVKVVLPLFLAPVLGLAVGYLAMNFLLFAFRDAAPGVNTLFRRLQIFTMLGLALSHSANDAQKSMGIIALGLFLSGELDSFHVPFGVMAACAAAIALGASRGDWRLIRTLGGKIYRIRPLNALASQTASAGLIMASSMFGAPVSTSQVIGMSLMGAGSAERINKVRWQVGKEMVATWALTIPATMGIAALVFWFSAVLSQADGLINRLINLLVRG